MSLTQTTAVQYASNESRCHRCNSILPPRATFCGTCGARVEKKPTIQLPAMGELTERYQLTTFVRRRPYVQLFLAHDTQGRRLVAIRDIDLSSLHEAARAQAVAILQQEYDLLRYQQIPDVMSVIDMRFHENHLYTVAGWPMREETAQESDAADTKEDEDTDKRLRTLHDVLQGNFRLPDEAVALSWAYYLCRAVHRLHQHAIVIGDLTPRTIATNGDSYAGRPALMVFWLPPAVRSLLPRTTAITNTSHFSAPEALLGHIEPRSDVYSLGALLYLLLTGTVPDEPTLRLERPIRTPRELNAHISPQVDDLVMRALAIERTDRFYHVGVMAKTIRQVYSSLPAATGQDLLGMDEAGILDDASVDDIEESTVLIVPLRTRLAKMHLSSSQVMTTEEASKAQGGIKAIKGTIASAEKRDYEVQVSSDAKDKADAGPSAHSGMSVFPEEEEYSEPQPRRKHLSRLLPALTPTQRKRTRSRTIEESPSFFKWLQRFFLGEQQHATTAAALIETPLRIQPYQSYTIRIHVTGRNDPQPPPGARKGTPPTGLSSLIQGEVVHIEVRSALYHNYAYVVQRADVTLPGSGYAAEVTIPMPPFTSGSGGRRERLHIFFTDELRRPLYEKPFVVEVFVSPLVQAGREGYNVLTIPL
jgi:serine/threonine protein kinase/ribosomal protein L40E